MSPATRRYLFFVSKPYSFAILEPLQNYLQDRVDTQVRWFLASTARNYEAPGDTLSTTEAVIAFDPEAVLVPGNVVPHFWPGLKVQVFHGLDDEVKGFYRISGLFDLYCTPGPATTQRFSQLAERYRHFLVIETGWPKLDPLAHTRGRQSRRRELSLEESQPVILYAPTFPPKYTSAADLLPVIEQLDDGTYQWLIKFHPLMDKELVNSYRALQGDNLQVINDLNILPWMEAADVLVTDTSSVAYEFLLLDRPIITYRALARKDKGVNILQPEDLSKAIERVLENPDEFAPQRREYADHLHPYSDGQSSRRVIEAIDQILQANLQRQLQRKPLNLVRKYKIKRMIS